MSTSPDAIMKRILDFSEAAETFSKPVGEMEDFKKLIDKAAAPINAVAKDFAATVADAKSFENVLGTSALRGVVADAEASIGNAMRFPPLPEPTTFELRDPVPVKVELPEPPEPKPWWQQGWILQWIGIGIAIALGIVAILI